jgi:hypothetical protein
VGTQSDGKHVLAYCSECGALVCPVADIWQPCACGGLHLIYPHVPANNPEWEWKLTKYDERWLRSMLISRDGFRSSGGVVYGATGTST